MNNLIKITVLLLALPLTHIGCGMMGGDVDEQLAEQEDRIAELEGQFKEELERLQAEAQHNELAETQSCGEGGPDANGNECPPADAAADSDNSDPNRAPASGESQDSDVAASDSPPPAS